jgi:chromosome segregation ATPase
MLNQKQYEDLRLAFINALKVAHKKHSLVYTTPVDYPHVYNALKTLGLLTAQPSDLSLDSDILLRIIETANTGYNYYVNNVASELKKIYKTKYAPYANEISEFETSQLEQKRKERKEKEQKEQKNVEEKKEESSDLKTILEEMQKQSKKIDTIIEDNRVLKKQLEDRDKEIDDLKTEIQLLSTKSQSQHNTKRTRKDNSNDNSFFSNPNSSFKKQNLDDKEKQRTPETEEQKATNWTPRVHRIDVQNLVSKCNAAEKKEEKETALSNLEAKIKNILNDLPDKKKENTALVYSQLFDVGLYFPKSETLAQKFKKLHSEHDNKSSISLNKNTTE